MGFPKPQGLYDARNEHDSCGVGFVAHIKGAKSHAIVGQALEILKNLDHRGAVGADPLLGDGAGILIQMPDALYRKWAQGQDLALPAPGDYAVAMCFLPQDAQSRAFVVEAFEKFIAKEGQRLIGWRDVPVTLDGLGKAVIAEMPVIRQCFIARGENCADQDAFERKLLSIRKQTQNPLAALAEKHSLPGITELYMPSFSSRTVVYKGLLLATQVGSFYDDLRDPLCVSALGLVHQRFSTNTFPSWKLAHPYRFIAHNGEINTVRGNVNWMNARRRTMESDLLGVDLDKMWPIIPHGQSDTACLDNALELLLAGGYSLAHAVMMLVPEAWSGNPLMDPKRRAFYEYHAALMEPWDGPAAVAFTDGRQIGATLDRNGLRPARFCVTDDDLVVMASESGVLPIKEDNIVRKWRLQPGKMLLIDLEEGRIIEDEDIKATLAGAEPYEEWLEAAQYKLKDLDDGRARAGAAAGRDHQPAGQQPAGAPAGLRLYPGRHLPVPRADGAGAGRSDRLDGHRHADRGAVEPQPPALRLFQAELRPGHQSADRPDPRGTGHEPGLDDRPAAEPARPRCRHAQAAGGRPADPDQRRPGQDPLGRNQRSTAPSAPRRSTSPGTPRAVRPGWKRRSRKCAGRRPRRCSPTRTS